MMDTTQAFIARLAERGYEPLLHCVTETIRWDIEDTGRWGRIDALGQGRVDKSAMEDSSQ